MTPAAYLSVLIEAPGCAHALHLVTTSLAEHQALGFLYEELPEAVDRLAEVYQGLEGRLSALPESEQDEPPEDDPQDFLAGLLAHTRENRDVFGDEPAVQALVDEVIAVIAQAKFRAELA